MHKANFASDKKLEDMKKYILSLVAATALSGAGAMAQTVAPFQNGDRAVFLGDSITDGGHYHSYIWLYYMTRYPYMDLRVFNAGIGGDTARDIYERLDGDVFSKKPDVLTVTFGMNDTGYFEYLGDDAEGFGKRKYEECLANWKLVEKRLEGLEGVRIVLLGGSPYDETAQIKGQALTGKNGVMEKVVGFQKKSAEEHGWEFLDFNRPLKALGEEMQKADPSFSLSMGDRVHPDNDGHMVMAYLYLKAQGFAGGKVADVCIDAKSGKVLSSENCIVSDVRNGGKELSFDYLAESLPYPLDTTARGFGAARGQAGVVKLVPFMEEMNQELLTVKGLKSGKWSLKIDDTRIGEFSAEELAAGINLAEMTWTPQYRQALAVMHLNEFRWEIERNFRDLAWMEYGLLQAKGLLDADDENSVKAIDAVKEHDMFVKGLRDNYSKMMHASVREARLAEMELLTEKIYEINKPEVHRITLKPEK